MTERLIHDHSSSINGNQKLNLLFDAHLLQSAFKQYALKDPKLQGNIYNGRYLIRPLAASDYDHGYVDLLRQLTECGKYSSEDFEKRFSDMKQCVNTYYILIIEDLDSDKQIIGSTTLVCEKKFIRQLGIRGRIEDVVVDHHYRGQQLGKLLIELLTKFAKEQCDCYKVSLECKDNLVGFYQQFGYDHEDKQNYLCQRFQK
ncbi:unnamed protein product [Adineta ricciae]|uniref:Glucosamine 6-phosphate N-acetyltransferase n=1 Tax=Adineta ricciae TaxID=249248 RepID=A0A814HQU7_ADIRI|nr:unnamed protein product [Adineta ricciae]